VRVYLAGVTPRSHARQTAHACCSHPPPPSFASQAGPLWPWQVLPAPAHYVHINLAFGLWLSHTASPHVLPAPHVNQLPCQPPPGQPTVSSTVFVSELWFRIVALIATYTSIGFSALRLPSPTPPFGLNQKLLPPLLVRAAHARRFHHLLMKQRRLMNRTLGFCAASFAPLIPGFTYLLGFDLSPPLWSTTQHRPFQATVHVFRSVSIASVESGALFRVHNLLMSMPGGKDGNQNSRSGWKLATAESVPPTVSSQRVSFECLFNLSIFCYPMATTNNRDLIDCCVCTQRFTNFETRCLLAFPRARRATPATFLSYLAHLQLNTSHQLGPTAAGCSLCFLGEG
jgi:hypothetical protein